MNGCAALTRAISAVAFNLLLSACNTAPTYVDPYEGLLPANFQLRDAPGSVQAEALRDKTLVMVTSANYIKYTEIWENYWDKGAAAKRDAKVAGAAEALKVMSARATSGGAVSNVSGGLASGFSGSQTGSLETIRIASDPRNVVYRVHEAVKPYFKQVRAASDFAEALDLKADYIMLVDYYGAWDAMGNSYGTRGGVYLLDGQLRRVLAQEGQASISREMGSIFSPVEGTLRGTANTYARGLDATLTQVLSGMRAKLGPAPR